MIKKSLGQHFLKNIKLAAKIVDAADLQNNDFVLEIGPGRGVLTDIIAEKMTQQCHPERPAGVEGSLSREVRDSSAIGWNDKGSGLFFAVEKDWALAEELKKKYHNRKNIKIICADILEKADELAESLGENYKLISNLPYNISNLILNKLYFQKSEIRNPKSETNSNVQNSNVSNSVSNLENLDLDIVSNFDIRYSNLTPRLAVLMLQQEVAERLVAKPGEKARGIPTVLLENVAEAKILVNHIKPGNFNPPPAVESAVIEIKRRENIEPLNPAVVKAGFSAKRQLLVNSLSRGLKMPKAEIFAIMKRAKISANLRAEDLTVENWRELCRFLETLKKN